MFIIAWCIGSFNHVLEVNDPVDKLKSMQPFSSTSFRYNIYAKESFLLDIVSKTAGLNVTILL
ncbi:MAG: hypothetical protein K0R00_698 [Herbinix sp.]|jgi:hypothetical protein|nr:hypothetical protein [Herbinix sp.]